LADLPFLLLPIDLRLALLKFGIEHGFARFDGVFGVAKLGAERFFGLMESRAMLGQPLLLLLVPRGLERAALFLVALGELRFLGHQLLFEPLAFLQEPLALLIVFNAQRVLFLGDERGQLALLLLLLVFPGLLDLGQLGLLTRDLLIAKRLLPLRL